MSIGYKFDRTARAERYFVDTLFAHFLLADSFSGLRLLFRHIFGTEACADLPEDFEIVSELDPLRDGSVENEQVKRLYREFKRVAVPDLFLRWSHLCLIIEGKFFTDPATEDLQKQVNLQREAIAKVKPFTLYKDWHFKFAILTINSVKPSADGLIVLSWEDVLHLMQTGTTIDIVYSKDIIRHALNRANQEIKATSKAYERLKYKDILAKLPQLIEQGKIFIGFTGGIDAFLSVAAEKELDNRAHYKVSDIRWSDNWITLDQFLHRVFELRGHFDKYNDESE